MASIINAATSGGLVTTADTSGVLQLQTAGTTAVTVDASQRVAFVAGTAALPALTTTGDTNTGIFFPAADTIAFSEGGAEAMRIDASGLLGIGTTSPSSFSTFPSKLVVGSGSGTESITIYSGTASEGNLIFADGTAGTAQYMGLVRYDHADNGLKFYTNGGTLRTTINSSGGLKTQNTIGVGDATPSTSGAGITFPATQSASSDANTLDDYEEGTWTPSVGGTATYSSRTGTYTKIGRQVTAWFDVTILLIGTGGGSLSGLPFTNTSSLPGVGGIGYFSSLVSSFVIINPIVPGSGVIVTFETATAAAATLGDNQNIWANSSRCLGFVTYHV